MQSDRIEYGRRRPGNQGTLDQGCGPDERDQTQCSPLAHGHSHTQTTNEGGQRPENEARNEQGNDHAQSLRDRPRM